MRLESNGRGKYIGANGELHVNSTVADLLLLLIIMIFTPYVLVLFKSLTVFFSQPITVLFPS